MNAPLRHPEVAADAALVHVRGLTVDFLGGRKPVRAVGGVDLDLKAGEALALLGESGSGKSVTLRALMRLLPEKRTRIGGTLRIDGQDVLALRKKSLAAFRGGTVAMIFQDPGLALDPVYRIGDQIAEAVVRHEGASHAQGRARALELFERVQIPSAARRLDNYPHEMSGGMRQRAMIALALACRPKVLLADEPTTALDATVQIQILLLLRELQRDLGLAVIFVTHDVGVAVQVADRVAVMYGGHLVEVGSSGEVIGAPAHPYTRGLLASRITPDSPKGVRLVTIPGSPPDLADPPPGCPFAPRCTLAVPACDDGLPERVALAPGHAARCIRVGAA
ncbi:ABC transporter ATP-binding protein [Methylobacterium oryzihabitans]|jgi:peptide/nickel transport system ATP-binding protein|uniref:ABC transporter ATP-binding protein n=1 Tax=Methylobacterium oryzihabitans TaxID=2499852 RepID=A0A3S2W891_9HYPH|nr:ABC transporter ATP-binding protein [Methylobacterium oryzihabitans]RVU16156.1 ABC transporter ATP-binding protein [Methylobacterium oryzihabitans]